MKMILFIIASCFLISCNNTKVVVQKAPKPVYLYEVKINNKIGFIDSTGIIKIKPKYNFVGNFSYNLIPVSIGGIEKIDTFNKVNGRMIGEYWAINKVIKGDKWGYIDTTGKFVIEPIYEYCFEFNDGIAAVRIGNLWGYIDTTGNFILPLKYDDALPFYDEYAAVKLPNSDSTIFIDKTGQKIFVSPGDVSMSFIDGHALIELYNKNYSSDSIYYKSGYLNTKGQYIVKPIYDILKYYHNGRALFGLKSEGKMRYGFLDQHGKIKISAQFIYATDFGDSIAWVVKDKQLYIIDINGKMLKTNKYENVQSFSEGVAAIKLNGKWGYCDKRGNITISPQFDEAQPFENGLASIKKGIVSGYINKNGKYIWLQSNR